MKITSRSLAVAIMHHADDREQHQRVVLARRQPSRSTTCDENMIVRMPTTTSVERDEQAEVVGDDDAEARRRCGSTAATADDRRADQPDDAEAADRHPLALPRNASATMHASAASVTQSIGTMASRSELSMAQSHPMRSDARPRACDERRTLARSTVAFVVLHAQRLRALHPLDASARPTAPSASGTASGATPITIAIAHERHHAGPFARLQIRQRRVLRRW